MILTLFSLSRRLAVLGLCDSILSLHPHASPPATHNCNTRRIPIDAIWTSPGISVSRSGYAPFDSSIAMQSNHRLLWIEVTNDSLLGKHLPNSRPVPASRVKSSDPRLRILYNRRVCSKFTEAKLWSRFRTLLSLLRSFSSGQTHLQPHLVSSYNSLHDSVTAIRFQV